MGWLKNWAEKKHNEEILQFVRGMMNGKDYEIGMTLALVEHHRIKLSEQFGWNLKEPMTVWDKDIRCTTKLSKMISQTQKQNNLPDAAALMVWLHTLRASMPEANVELRAACAGMWSILMRGRDLVHEEAKNFSELTGRAIVVDENPETPPSVIKNVQNIR